MTASAPRGPDRLQLAGRVAWNLRGLALFLVGPVVGVGLGGAIFGMPTDLIWAAAVAFLISLSMFGLLVRGEWRRLAVQPGRPVS